jgi:hypothetical protein
LGDSLDIATVGDICEGFFPSVAAVAVPPAPANLEPSAAAACCALPADAAAPAAAVEMPSILKNNYSQ